MDHELTAPEAEPRKRRRLRRGVKIVAAALAIYLAVAYVFLPLAWTRYGRRHPSLEDVPHITYAAHDIPGDPLNVALIGSEADVKQIMHAAGWYPAAALSLRSDLKIAEDTVLKHPDDEAPVSNLFLFGRKEDLAFEKPVGDNPRQRHHVRLWKTNDVDADGRPIWIGAAIYDRRVGFSRTTLQITHHIAADIDAERDFLCHDLEQTGDLAETYTVPDFQARAGRNGGGDPWHSDGNLWVGIIALKQP